MKTIAKIGLISFLLVLAGCSSTYNPYSTSVGFSTGIYGGYGYPYGGYGYYPGRPYYPGHPGKPNHPNRPDRPTTKPMPKPGVSGRPSSRPSSMGRPRGGMSRSMRMPRGSGGRRR